MSIPSLTVAETMGGRLTVEYGDPVEDALRCNWNVSSWGFGFRSGQGYILDPAGFMLSHYCFESHGLRDLRVGIYCIGESSPEPHEMTQGAFESEILDEWPRLVPVLEAVHVLIWTTSANNNESHDIEPNDEHDLETGERKFHLAVNAYEHQIGNDE